MRKFIVIVAALLMVALPTFAQDEATPEVQPTAPAVQEETPAVAALPAGCNTGTLSQIFTNAGEGLAKETLTAEEAVYLIDMLDESLTAMRNACAPDEAPVDANVFDYSGIPQTRSDDGAFVLGEADAPITIVEFADFLCPHCQTYHATMQKVIVRGLKG